MNPLVLTRNILDNQLRRFRNNTPSDITDKVFLEIEKNPQLRSQYNNAVRRSSQHTVNMRIGREVRIYWDLPNTGRNYSPQSSLIESYTEH